MTVERHPMEIKEPLERLRYTDQLPVGEALEYLDFDLLDLPVVKLEASRNGLLGSMLPTCDDDRRDWVPERPLAAAREEYEAAFGGLAEIIRRTHDIDIFETAERQSRLLVLDELSRRRQHNRRRVDRREGLYDLKYAAIAGNNAAPVFGAVIGVGASMLRSVGWATQSRVREFGLPKFGQLAKVGPEHLIFSEQLDQESELCTTHIKYIRPRTAQWDENSDGR